jgi:signal transduction histidine kinase
MTRPLHAWLAFGLCLLIILAAMGWMTRSVLQLERAEEEARREAAVEEAARLALWRMDSALTPVLARESSRPVGEAGGAADATGEPPFVLLRFETGADGTLVSLDRPKGKGEVPGGKGRPGSSARLEAFRARVSHAALQAALFPPDAGSPEAVVELLQEAEPEIGQQMAQQQDDSQQQRQQPAPYAQTAQSAQMRQSQLNLNEFRARAQNVQQGNRASVYTADGPEAGLLEPRWIEGELVLARRLVARGRPCAQGLWLDRARLEAWLLEGVKDLFPAARLEPAPPGSVARRSRRLAALPAALVTGPLPAVEAAVFSPVRISLLIVWVFTVLVSAAAAALLRGVLALSERRAAFVSAVTHELRTPLTTFRMYTEMLAGGMVPEEKRAPYLETISREATRLGHLVANVLAYARLEKGRPAGRLEAVAAEDLIAKSRESLEERARQALLDLEVDLPEECRGVRARADPAAVEQVLFNLVDNACKYAGKGDDRRIRIEVRCAERGLSVRVRDFGPGIAETRRLFRPFSRPAHEAAGSAPGVGLGLALSRRLARAMGGDLRLDPSVQDGACFELRLRGA